MLRNDATGARNAAAMRRVVVIEPNGAEEWDAFVRTQDSGMIYHTWGWKECLEKSFPHLEGHLLAVLEQASGKIAAGLPVYSIKSWLLGNRMSSVPFASVSDPLISSAADMELLLPEVLRIYHEDKAKSLQIKTWEKRVELGGPFELGDRFIIASEQGEAETIVMRDIGKVGIQFHAVAKCAFGCWPVTLVI